jgi:hypothetical protein
MLPMGGTRCNRGDDVDFDNEAPLLEELEINPREIWVKTLGVSLPFRPLPAMVETDTDLTC